jgi:hypothetical protein
MLQMSSPTIRIKFGLVRSFVRAGEWVMFSRLIMHDSNRSNCLELLNFLP